MKTLYKICVGIFITVCASAVIGIFVMLFEIRDDNKFKQPQIDKEQNRKIENADTINARVRRHLSEDIKEIKHIVLETKEDIINIRKDNTKTKKCLRK